MLGVLDLDTGMLVLVTRVVGTFRPAGRVDRVPVGRTIELDGVWRADAGPGASID